MPATMIISEKNKAAQAIAEALGPVKTIPITKYFKIYSIPSRNIYVIPLRGHIVQYVNSPLFKSWSRSNPRDIITDRKAIIKTPNSYAAPYIKALKKYAKLCDVVVVGTDADVEGCVIGLIDAVPFVKTSNPKIQIQQLWLNDLQKSSIQLAYQNLIPPKWSWAYSGDARAIIDAIIGFSATREVSLTLKPILQKIDVQFTSIGRVQSSLLYLLYLREHLIRNFIPTQFWTLSAQAHFKDRKIPAFHVKNNFSDKKLAETIYTQIQKERTGTIQDIKTRVKSIPPPVPLNTSKALLLLTKKLKITAKMALKAMEALYLNKIISYPRTDSDVYSKTYDHRARLQKFSSHTQYGAYANDRVANGKITPRKGKLNAGDHTPITPILSLEIASSRFENNLQRKVYNLIARSYLASFGEPAEESSITILLHIKDQPFVARLAILIKEGFYRIAPFLAKKYDTPLASAAELERWRNTHLIIPISGIKMQEKDSQPPPRYNDTSVLRLMEQKKLGTKSTRPNIIQILIDRNYIERKNRSFFVKELGFLLIDALVLIWKPFLDPQFTADVELGLEAIRTQTKTKNQVVLEIKQRFLQLFDLFRAQKPTFMSKMNTLTRTGNVLRGRNNQIITPKSSRSSKKGSFKSSSSRAASLPSNSPVMLSTSPCPKCGQHKMKLVISRDKTKKFLVCADENCKTYLSLPKKGTPRLLKNKCKICQFNVIKITTRANNRLFEYYICPNCWNQGLATKSGEGFCSKCNQYKIVNGRCVEK